MILQCPQCHSRYDVSGKAPGTRVHCPCGTSFLVPKLDSRAGQIRCPCCGASCSPTDSSCSYCNTRLAMVACPACLGRVFAENRFCPHCGAKLSLAAKPAPETLPAKKCPRCQGKIDLHSFSVDRTLLHECPQCGGVWLDNHSFERLLAERESTSWEKNPLCQTACPTISEPRSTPPRNYIPCPECGQLMNPRNFARFSGVIVDICKAHGIWFDQGELNAIVRFVKNGGLDKARSKELDEARRELERKKAQLQSLPDQEQSSWTPEGRSSTLLGWVLRVMADTFFS